MSFLSINIFKHQNRSIIRHRLATVIKQSPQLVTITSRTQPAHTTTIRKNAIRRRQLPRKQISRRKSFQRVTSLPSRSAIRRIPANNNRGHAVSNQLTATLLHLHRQTILLPPPSNSSRSSNSPTVRRTHTRLNRSEIYARNNTSDTASHLIHASSKQIRDTRHSVLFHVRQRNLHSAVID